MGECTRKSLTAQAVRQAMAQHDGLVHVYIQRRGGVDIPLATKSGRAGGSASICCACDLRSAAKAHCVPCTGDRISEYLRFNIGIGGLEIGDWRLEISDRDRTGHSIERVRLPCTRPYGTSNSRMAAKLQGLLGLTSSVYPGYSRYSRITYSRPIQSDGRGYSARILPCTDT